jgi:formyl-CoA transferase
LNRKRHEDKINGIVDEWTSQQCAEDVMRDLQAAGLKASVVFSYKDFVENPDFRKTDFLCFLDHPEMGRNTYMAPPFRLSKSKIPMRPAPCLGEDTEYVLTEILGMSDSDFLQLLQAGVLQ